MLDVDTEVTPPEPDEDEDDDISSTRITVSIMDVGDTHYDAAVQLFDVSANDPEKGAEALLSAVLAAAQLRGSDHYWALLQRTTTRAAPMAESSSNDDDLLDLTAAERTLRKLADDARADHAAGRRPDDLFECYRLVIDELDRVRARLRDLEGEGPRPNDGRQPMREPAPPGDERWTVTWVDSGTIDRESGEVIPAGWWVIGQSDEVCDEYAFSTIHVEFSYDEHGHDITEQIARRVAVGLRAQDGLTAAARAVLAIRDDPTAAHPGPRYQEALDALREALPPFAPELADAPLVTGESGGLAPLIVDHPVHDSTLPVELEQDDGR